MITGATDGIGLATARELVSHGRRVLLRGRNPSKLDASGKYFDNDSRRFAPP